MTPPSCSRCGERPPCPSSELCRACRYYEGGTYGSAAKRGDASVRVHEAAPKAGPRVRFDLQPLLEAAGLSPAAWARANGVSGQGLRRAIAVGLTDVQADRHAVRLGRHPVEVWPDWFMYAPPEEKDPNIEAPPHQVQVDKCSKNEGTTGYYNNDLSAVDDAWIAATGAVWLLADLERRLVAAGAVIELRQFRGLSAQEVAILVERERGTPVEHRVSGVPAGHGVVVDSPEELSRRSDLVVA